jgi:hypothetical protein
VTLAWRARWRTMSRAISGSLMLGVWLLATLTGPVPSAGPGRDSGHAPLHGTMAHSPGSATLICDRSDPADPCAHCGTGACLAMQGCTTSGCLVLCQLAAPAARSVVGGRGSIPASPVAWRTRSLVPPTPPPLAIHDQRA